MIVLDTNVLSEAMRPRPDAAVIDWLNSQAAETLFLPSVALAELLFGVGTIPDGERKVRLQRALEALLGLFPNRILAFDEAVAQHFARMAVAARTSGKPLATADGYIAATAAAHGFAVATRNVSDFHTTRVPLINPWQWTPGA